jgi:NAD(P) transhydrogenase subunit alpha
MTILFVPRETQPGETRVAATPETVRRFVRAGVEVLVERGAGAAAAFPDSAYADAGASLTDPEAWATADLIAKVQPPTLEEAARLSAGAIIVCMVIPAAQLELVRALRESGVTCLALDLVPRITRAQSMDVLSSQATIAGYKAVLLAAAHLSKLCPLLMTAAGTIKPAKVVVFGAGVAGLQAIATARRLGCVVEATDVRLAAKEQVESLGAKFIEVEGAEDLEDEGGYAKEASAEFLERQRAEVARRVAEAHIVITTALIPGRTAPILVTEEMVRSMPAGSVIVDLAVESGGNCVLSEAGEYVRAHGVTIIGERNLPATVPADASDLFSKNVLSLLKPFIVEGALILDMEDEVIAGCCLTHAGELCHAPTAELLSASAKVKA